MAFKPGNKLAGSRKGVPNRRSVEFTSVLERHNFCPVTAMIEVYQEARKIYDNYGVIYGAICAAKIMRDGEMGVPPEDKAHVYLKLAGDMAKDITSYTYPKLKAIEQVKSANPLDGMNAKEKLAAFKQAVALLESEVKGESGPSAI